MQMVISYVDGFDPMVADRISTEARCKGTWAGVVKESRETGMTFSEKKTQDHHASVTQSWTLEENRPREEARFLGYWMSAEETWSAHVDNWPSRGRTSVHIPRVESCRDGGGKVPST
jgi:hypothetical protein